MDKRWKRAAIVAALLIGAPAYGQQPSTSTATGSAHQALKGDLAEKIQELHAANKAEVQLGQLGSQKAQSPEVKQYAEKLSKDHQKNDEKLRQIAQPLGVNLEGKQFQEKQEDASKDLAKLQEKQGHEFDQAFIKHMVKDHKKDVKEVESAAKEAREQNQTQLASFLETTHTGLQGHLQEAERIEKSLGQGRAQAQSGSSAGSMGTGSGAAGATGAASGGTSGTTGAPSGSSPQTGSSGSSTPGDRPQEPASPGAGSTGTPGRPTGGGGGGGGPR